MWFEFYRYGSLFIYDQNLILYSRILSSPQWHYQESRLQTDMETNLYSNGFTSDSFFEILFYIVYYFWQSGIFALCVFYLLSNSIKLWWRAQFTSEAYLSPFSSGFRQLWRGNMTRSLISTRLWLACTDWWLMRRWKMKWPVTARRGREPRY